MNCPHNASGYYTIYGDESLHADHFEARLATGDIHTTYARTGYLGFIRRTEMTQHDGGNESFTLVYICTLSSNARIVSTSNFEL